MVWRGHSHHPFNGRPLVPSSDSWRGPLHNVVLIFRLDAHMSSSWPDNNAHPH